MAPEKNEGQNEDTNKAGDTNRAAAQGNEGESKFTAAENDPAQNATLRRLIDVQRIGQMLYEREAERRAHKYGLSDPRTQRMIQVAGGARTTLSALEDVRNRGVKIPERPPGRATTVPGRGDAQRAEDVTFTVRGRVLRADGKPAAGLLVRIYDKDQRYDELISAAITNRKGEFSATYRYRDFSEKELAADLYVIVADADDTILLSTENAVTFDAKRETVLELTLPPEKPTQ